MKKIPTLFKREFEGHNIVRVLPELSDESLSWVLEGYGIATVKYDGACCAIFDNKLYIRYDAKNGKPIPENAIKCQEEADPVTGHLPCWIPYDENNKGQKWYKVAYDNFIQSAKDDGLPLPPRDGTYEAIGKHFNGNMYNLDTDVLIRHGDDVIYACPRTFEGIRDYLKDNFIEGIVFWKDDEPKCKIKRSDFGFPWQEKHR